MNTQAIAADIVRRLDALRQDSPQNAADTIASMLDRETEALRNESRIAHIRITELQSQLAFRTAELEGVLNAVNKFCQS